MITRAKISAVRANSFFVYSVFPGYSRAALINFFVSDAALIRVNTVFLTRLGYHYSMCQIVWQLRVWVCAAT